MLARFDYATKLESIRRDRPVANRLGRVILAGFVALVISWSAGDLFAAARIAEPPGRYLLIVDTSFSMRRSAENMQNVVGNLVASGMNAELRPGDTIGLWTFNDELHAGNFPLQRWTPQTRQRVATGVVEFLQRQPYERKTQYDKVLGPMGRVIKDSDKITVVLITDGEEKFSGTPFDEQINAAYKLNISEQRRRRLPFVTVLRAQAGQFIGWKVNTPPWPVEFPEFPAKPVAVAPDSPPPVADVKPVPPPVVVTTPTNAIAGETAVTEAKSISEPVPGVPVELPQPDPPAPQPTLPAEPPAPHTTLIAQPPPGVPEDSLKTESPPFPKPEPPPKTELPPTPSVPPVVSLPPDSEPATVLPPKPAEPVQIAKVERTPDPTTPAPVITAPPPAAPTPDALPMVEAKPAEPAAGPVAMPTTRPPAGDSPALTEVPLVQTAVATSADSWFNRSSVIIAGVVLMLVALGLLFAFMRRTRATPKVSLITRSMDREEK
ncbi:MAG: VWA domain-containing protein [Verrucomicrobia bacterium]|nr:VWA domain-containing protein [Verrucomicrobiota bacterium]